MAKTPTRIPSHLYITLKDEYERVDADDGSFTWKRETIGFLHAYSPKKGFEQKHHNQDHFAYQTYFTDDYRNISTGLQRIEADNGEFYLSGHMEMFVPDGQTAKWQGWKNVPITQEVNDRIRPRIWENKPMRGFKIVDFVSRSTTSNKFWRVQDPRGGVFEISTPAFEKIIMKTDIIKGEIQAECLWVGNTNLIVKGDQHA